MVPKRRPGRPPKNPPMQTFPSYGGNKVGSLPLQPGSTEDEAAAVATATAAQAIGSKTEPQAKEESESEPPDDGGRSHKRARKEADEQPPEALPARMQL